MSRASVIRELQGRHYEKWKRKRRLSSPRSRILETARRQLERQKYFESLTFALWGMGLDMTAEEIRRNHYRMEMDDLRRERIGKRTLGELLNRRANPATKVLNEEEVRQVHYEPPPMPADSDTEFWQHFHTCTNGHCFGIGSRSIH
jgi:hypothetical protein